MKEILCPKCWEKNPVKNTHCYSCGIILKDIDEETDVKIPKRKNKWLKKKKITLSVSLILIIVLLPLVGLTIYGQIMNSYSGNFEMNAYYDQNQGIITANVTVLDLKIKIKKVIVIDNGNNETIGITKIDRVLTASESITIHINLKKEPCGRSLSVELIGLGIGRIYKILLES